MVREHLALLTLATLVAADGTTSIAVPLTRPTGVAVVPPDFVGSGFDSGFLPSYANNFSQNLMDSVQQRMGAPMILRVGGTSGDHLTYSPGQQAPTECIGSRCPNQAGTPFSIGPSYFEAFLAFPNQHFTFQAPLGIHGSQSPANLTATLDYVTRAYPKVGADRLAAIALGNEVSYEKTASFYASHAKTLQQEILSALGLAKESTIQQRIFEVLDTSSNSVQSQEPFTLAQTFSAGIDSNNLTAIAAEHFYQIMGGPTPSLQAGLMNHTAIKNRFANHAKSIAYLRANFPNIPYVLSETGAALTATSNVVGVFGSTLWAVDFQLYSMSQGVARVAATQRPYALHSPWIPVAIPNGPEYGIAVSPAVRASFWAEPFMADFVGSQTNSTNGAVEIDLDSDVLTAYAIYEGKTLARVALVNMNEWNAASGATRNSATFQFSVPSGTSTVSVGRLQASQGAESYGYDTNSSQPITWLGQQWAYSNGLGVPFPSTQDFETVKVQDGMVLVNVPDTEAVIVYLQ